MGGHNFFPFFGHFLWERFPRKISFEVEVAPRKKMASTLFTLFTQFTQFTEFLFTLLTQFELVYTVYTVFALLQCFTLLPPLILFTLFSLNYLKCFTLLKH